MKKSFLFSILVCLILALVSGVFITSEKSADALDCDASTEFAVKDYETLEEVFSYKSNDFSGKTIRLYRDFDLSVFTAPTFWNKDNKFFNGTFDGNGHVLYGCKTNLFKTIDSDGKVRNVTFVDAALTTEYALAETNLGEVSNVVFHGAHTSGAYSGIIKKNNGIVTGLKSYLDIFTSGTAVYPLVQEGSGTMNGSAYVGSIYSTSSSEPYDVSVTQSEPYLKTTTYNYFTVYPFPISGVSRCSVQAYIQTKKLPLEVSALSGNKNNVKITYTNETDTQYAWGTTKNVSEQESASSAEDNTFTGTISSCYLFYDPLNEQQASLICTDSYESFLYNTATYEEPSYSRVDVVWDEAKNVSADFNDLSSGGDGYLLFTEYYPVLKTFVKGEGTLVSPVLVEEAEDFYSLAQFVRPGSAGSEIIYAEIKDNVDLKKREKVRSTWVGTELSVAGENYWVRNNVNGLFGEEFTATYSSDPVFTEPSGWSAFSDPSTSTVDGSSVTEWKGTGTENDPYLISTAEEWVAFVTGAKNAVDIYAVLSEDIPLNTTGRHGKRLGTSGYTLYATIDGCGHTLYGLAGEYLFESVEGTLKNMTVYTLSSQNVEEYSARAVLCLDNTGTISGVTVKGNADYESAFVEANDGLLTRCVNYLNADAAFCFVNEGTISYCINEGNCSSIDNVDTGEGCVQCISVSGSDYYLLNGDKTIYDSADYLVLTENEYDSDIFGYEVGVIRPLPSLRVYEKNYKTETSITLSDLPALTYGEGAYSNDDFVDDDDELVGVICSWTYTYNDVTVDYTLEMEDDQVDKEVGTYTLTAYLVETLTTLPKRATTSFEIKQDDCGIKANNIVFESLELVYTGSCFANGQLQPTATEDNHLAELSAYGFSFTYSYTKGGVSITRDDIVDVGTYKQAFQAVSKNYKTITKTARNIIVTKAPLTVVVAGSTTVRYGSTADLTGFTASAGFLGKDSAASLSSVVSDYASRFRTDHLPTLSAGSVASVWFDVAGITLDNYMIAMSAEEEDRGTITVTKAPISQGDISFYGATADAEGSHSFVYDGASHLLSATGIPSNLGYSYAPADHSFKNVGVYTLTLTVDDPGTDDNYESLVLTVNVEVTRATLTFTAGDLEKYYGYQVDYADFTYTVEGLKGGDTLESVFENAGLIAARPSFLVGATPDYGTDYPIAVLYDGGEVFTTDNYEVVRIGGTFSIVKIPLTTIYQNNQSVNTDFSDDGKVFDGEGFDLKNKEITFFDEYNIFVEAITYTYWRNNTELTGDDTVVTNAGRYRIVATVTMPAESNYSDGSYSCDYVISKKPTSLSCKAAEGYESNFASSGGVYTYTYTYVPSGTVMYRTLEYCAFEGTGLPDGAEVTLAGDSPLQVGNYTIRFEYDGDDNHEPSSVSATVRVLPYVATLSAVREYVYTSSAVTPSVTVTNTTGLTVDKLSYAFVDEYEVSHESVSAVGVYRLIVTCGDGNYSLENNSFEIEIKPLAVAVSIPSFSFEYGTTGDYTFRSGDRDYAVTIEDNYVIFKNYAITTEDYPTLTSTQVIDIRFRLSQSDNVSYFPAGEYTLVSGGIVQPRNFVLTFQNDPKVAVRQRKITVTWYVLGKVCDENYTLEYEGRSFNKNVSYTLSGFAPGEEIISANYSISKKDSLEVAPPILTVGEYTCLVNFNNTDLDYYRLNYYIDSLTSRFSIEVVKKHINVTVRDATVEVRENFAGPSAVVSPDELVGADAEQGKTLNQLSGYSMRYTCAYDPYTASVGDTFDISVEITLENYIADVVIDANRTAAARLTVVQNSLPDYVFVGATYVYDGTPKSITIPSVDSRINVQYKNNGKTSVGTYLVEATLTYTTTGRVVNKSAEMRIVQATPTVEVDPVYTVYRVGEKLKDGLLTGRAYVGSGFSIAGTFSFDEENTMRTGTRTYSVTFVPNDGYNVLSKSDLQVTVKCFSIDSSILRFSGNYDDSAIGTISIKNRVIGEIDRESVAEIYDRLQLWQNGAPVNRFMFEEAGKELLEIKFDGETVYSRELTVEVRTEEKTQETVTVNETFFQFQDVEMDLENSVIYVSEFGGQIALSEAFSEEYELYVGNLKVGSSGAILSPTDGFITVEIRHKKTMGTVYIKQFQVKDAEELIAPEEKGTFNMTVMYIIIGVAGALVVGGVLLLLLRKK